MDSFTTARPAQSKMSAATGRGALVPDLLVGAGISLIVIVGLIHLINSPGDLEEGAYTGVLYLANFVGALAAAVGIYRGKRWGLGARIVGRRRSVRGVRDQPHRRTARAAGRDGVARAPGRALPAGRRPVRGAVPGHRAMEEYAPKIVHLRDTPTPVTGVWCP